MTLILFNKPYGVLSQFTDTSTPPRPTLAAFGFPKDVYAAGRLDYDSEGLLLLTDDGKLAQTISHPRHKLEKTYWVQVEGNASEEQLQHLRQGVVLKDGKTRPAQVDRLPPPQVWPRTPPIRVRKTVPDMWLRLSISEGKNRQVRRMTAAVGLPTLRLIRARIGAYTIQGLASGEWRNVDTVD